MQKNFSKKIYFSFILGIIIFSSPYFVFASERFFVDSSYDLYSRKEIEAEHVLDIGNLSFFVDKDYYSNLSQRNKDKIRGNFFTVGEEFRSNIYPKLTNLFGNEPFYTSGKITILFHQMQKSSGGYFHTGDQYTKYQNPRSNERNILYISSNHIESNLLSPYLAHEFIHLITFNQKDNLNNIEEEIWLNELRAEYAITYLGYDDLYKNSNLEKRVNTFLAEPNTSLTEWTGKIGDYGIINLFAQYLVNHYGIEILSESLKSPYIGIESINYALEKRGYEEKFSDIFTNWTIALFLNDCKYGEKYCYKNENLKNLKVMPQTTYLPQANMTQMIISVSTKDWSPNWQRIFGGSGKLTLSFDGDDSVKFKIPALLCKDNVDCSISFLDIDSKQNGSITIDEFEDISLVILPSIQNKIKGFNGSEKNYTFSFDISIKKEEKEDIEKLELLERIKILQQEVKRLQRLIDIKNGNVVEDTFCSINNNLYFGIMNSNEVKCLQEFLKLQGTEIYPEGIISGNFLTLTKNAVIRFQQKYAPEILNPINLKNPTGYVGLLTRNKINSF